MSRNVSGRSAYERVAAKFVPKLSYFEQTEKRCLRVPLNEVNNVAELPKRPTGLFNRNHGTDTNLFTGAIRTTRRVTISVHINPEESSTRSVRRVRDTCATFYAPTVFSDAVGYVLSVRRNCTTRREPFEKIPGPVNIAHIVVHLRGFPPPSLFGSRRFDNGAAPSRRPFCSSTARRCREFPSRVGRYYSISDNNCIVYFRFPSGSRGGGKNFFYLSLPYPRPATYFT